MALMLRDFFLGCVKSHMLHGAVQQTVSGAPSTG